MARKIVVRTPCAKKSAFAEEFKVAELLTLGLIYGGNERLAGGTYRPFLKKVVRFSDQMLSMSIR